MSQTTEVKTSLLHSSFLVVDTETTGIDPSEHRTVEVAAVMVKGAQLTAAFTTYVNPGRGIPAQASAVHGLVDDDVADAPRLEQVLPWLNGIACKADAIVAHNAPFDRPMLPGLVDMPWLDTLRLARRLHPDLESHSNQSLRYALGLRCPEAAGMPAHRALADAYVTARLLVRLLGDVEATWQPTLAELIHAVDSPMLLSVCGFGKHKGTPWAQIPRDYLQWMLGPKGMTDMDIDTRFTAEHYLKA